MDWSLVNPKKYLQVYFLCKKSLFQYYSKGCPAKCTFCFNPDYHKSSHRVRSTEHVVEEIEYLIKNHGVDGIYFADEYWVPEKETMHKFFSLIKEKNLDFKWGVQTRLGVLDPDDLQNMYNAGCRWILFGVESGCKDRIKEIKKGIDLDKIKDTFAVCRNIGITTQSAFIIGYPDETEDEVKQTVRLALDLNANLAPFSILYLQPRSEMLHAAVGMHNFIPPSSLREWGKIDPGEAAFMNLSKVPEKDLKVIHYAFQWRGFSAKESITNDSYGVAKKVTADVLGKDVQIRSYQCVCIRVCIRKAAFYHSLVCQGLSQDTQEVRLAISLPGSRGNRDCLPRVFVGKEVTVSYLYSNGMSCSVASSLRHNLYKNSIRTCRTIQHFFA
jgi:pyruvate-formate lyase-activating enzyme